MYKLWAQFQRSGRLIVVPFVFRVYEGEAAAVPATKQTSVPTDAVKITVSNAGYEPSTIKARKGQSLKLAFYRPDAENCGNEVIFPQLQIRRKLPVGETTIIEVVPSQTGELDFTCGMGMLKGKLVVSEN